MKATRKKGQTLIEFIFVSVVFVFMLVLTFNAILAFCIHQYVSYATFMAARAYQASAESPETQVANAKATFASFFPGLTADQVGPQMSVDIAFAKFNKRKLLLHFDQVSIASPQAGKVGFRADTSITVAFKVPFAQLPLGQAAAKKLALIQLIARSELGREVTRQECRTYFQTRFDHAVEKIRGGGLGKNLPPTLWQNMDDNGC